MRRMMLALGAVLDRVARAACLAAGLLLVATVLLIVVLRYGFGSGAIALQDFAGYAFAVFLILAIPVCLAEDGHVRVEVFSERQPPGYNLWADRVALVVFLIPVFGLLIWAAWPTLVYSWSIREGSIETGGLPGLYLVKTMLPVAAALTIVQGVAAVLRPRQAGDEREPEP